MTRRRRRRRSQPVPQATNASHVSAPPEPPSRMALDVAVPSPGEIVPWVVAFRADLPAYVVEQIREVAHRMRCTRVALLLRLLAAFRDPAGRPVFHVRTEDLVPDRRRAGTRGATPHG